MMHVPGLFDLSDHLARLSATGDPLEALERHVDFEAFRTVLMEALGYGVRAKGGRPPYDPVTMFKVLVLASMHNLSDERMEFLIRDRLSWLRFLRFEIGEPTPDQKTIWLFREKLTQEKLTQSGAFKSLFAAFEEQLCERGYKPTGGQIVDATLVSAPRQRMRKEEKERARAGESASAIWRGRSCQGHTERHRRTSGGQLFQGAKDRRRGTGRRPCRHFHPSLWVQEPHQY